MNRQIAATPFSILTLACFLSFMGCGNGSKAQVNFDERVEQDLLLKYDQVEALKFFSNGGKFCDLGIEGEKPIDKPVIVPILEKIEEQVQVKGKILRLKDKPAIPIMLVIELPQDELQQQQIRTILDMADKEFGGMVLEQWGKRWLALDFISESEVAALNLKEGDL